MAENTGNPTAEAVKDKELEAEAKNTELTTSSSMETTRAKGKKPIIRTKIHKPVR